MAQVPDFLLLHCVNADAPDCVNCGRDFLIPISGIAGFQKDPTGNVVVYPKKDWIGTHECISGGRKFHTSTSWADLVTALNGSVSSVVNVSVVQE